MTYTRRNDVTSFEMTSHFLPMLTPRVPKQYRRVPMLCRRVLVTRERRHTFPCFVGALRCCVVLVAGSGRQARILADAHAATGDPCPALGIPTTSS